MASGSTGKVGGHQFDRLLQSAQGMLKEGRGARRAVLGQLTEALQTGGVDAKIPLIQRAVEASQQASAAGLARTKEDLAKHGIGGLFARRTLAEQRQAGEQRAAGLPSEMVSAIIAQTLPFLQATQTAGLGGLSQALSGLSQAKQFNAAQTANALDSIGRNAHVI